MFETKKKTKTLTKNDVVENIYEKIGDHPHYRYKYPDLTFYSRNKCICIVESMLEIIKGTLGKGEDVLISGFGKFCVKEKRARIGRNPALDKPMELRARKVVSFKYSGNLKNKINKKK